MEITGRSIEVEKLQDNTFKIIEEKQESLKYEINNSTNRKLKRKI